MATAHVGLICAKRFVLQPDGSIQEHSYPKGATYWFFKAAQAATVCEMTGELRRQAARRTEIIAMGAPVPGLSLGAEHRRLWAQDAGNTLADVRRAWLVIDVDDAPVPEGLAVVERLVECGGYIRDTLLPPEFQGVVCIVTPTARTGKNPGLARLRLWFLLDRPLWLREMYDWGFAAKACGVPVDPSLFQPGQPIYVARPIYDGLPDPVPVGLRAAVVAGTRERVALVLDRYDAEAAKKRAETAKKRPAVVPDGFTPKTPRIGLQAPRGGLVVTNGGNWRAVLLAGAGGPEGFFMPLTRALGLAVMAGDSADDVCAFVASFLAQGADPGRQDRYGPDWVCSTLHSFRTKDASRRAAIAADKARLFTTDAARNAAELSRKG
jgi:hypothetical protein